MPMRSKFPTLNQAVKQFDAGVIHPYDLMMILLVGPGFG